MGKSDPDKKRKAGAYVKRLMDRSEELQEIGLEPLNAFDRAAMEELIESYWPSKWGNDFVSLIGSDFKPPENEIKIESLGITILPEKLEKTILRARTVLQARVTIYERSVDAIIDASWRMNLLLGAMTLRSVLSWS